MESDESDEHKIVRLVSRRRTELVRVTINLAATPKRRRKLAEAATINEMEVGEVMVFVLARFLSEASVEELVRLSSKNYPPRYE